MNLLLDIKEKPVLNPLMKVVIQQKIICMRKTITIKTPVNCGQLVMSETNIMEVTGSNFTDIVISRNEWGG